MLYGPTEHLEWLSVTIDGRIQIETGPASRQFKIRIAQVWDALNWLQENNIIEKVSKGPKRGVAIIKINPPTNLNTEVRT